MFLIFSKQKFISRIKEHFLLFFINALIKVNQMFDEYTEASAWKEENNEYEYGLPDDTDESSCNQKPTIVLVGLKRFLNFACLYSVIFENCPLSIISCLFSFSLYIGFRVRRNIFKNFNEKIMWTICDISFIIIGYNRLLMRK